MTKWKAGRGGPLYACASIPLPISPSTTPVVIRGRQVARPDGRRFRPSERGASDHWWSHRPFLRRRLDDRLCPSTTSCAVVPHRYANMLYSHCYSTSDRRRRCRPSQVSVKFNFLFIILRVYIKPLVIFINKKKFQFFILMCEL